MVEPRHHLEYLTRIWRPEISKDLYRGLNTVVIVQHFTYRRGLHGTRGAARHIIGNCLAISLAISRGGGI